MKSIVLVGFVLAAPVHAQVSGSPAARANDDYGDLFRRAVDGRSPVVQAQDEPREAQSDRAVAAPSAPSSSDARSADLDSGGLDDAIRIHSAGEYASEPHHVSIVDRSRYAAAFRPTTIPNTIGLPAGSIIVDTQARQLYFGLPDGSVRRYGVAVGKAGKAWHGTATVGRKARWPDWHPTANIRRENRRLKRVVDGGAGNPLGARAIYLFQGDRDTLYRIHGTTSPASIGKFASHGCIRMINEDVIELYSMVRQGATVEVR